jgi:hypothetical protein
MLLKDVFTVNILLKTCVFSGDCRAFKIKVKEYTDNHHGHEEDKYLVMKFERECRCTFLCCNRPHLEVYLVSGDHQEFIGRVVW